MIRIYYNKRLNAPDEYIGFISEGNLVYQEIKTDLFEICNWLSKGSHNSQQCIKLEDFNRIQRSIYLPRIVECEDVRELVEWVESHPEEFI